METNKPKEKYIRDIEEIHDDLESLDEYTAENIESFKKSIHNLISAVRNVINGNDGTAEYFLQRAEEDL